jgi:hypothetical protein
VSVADRIDFDDGVAPRPVAPTPVRPVAPAAPFNWKGIAPWAATVVLTLAFGGYVLWDRHNERPGPTPPTPVADYDPAFVPIGKQVRDRFARAFAEGYEDGTKVFEAGQTRSMMIETGKTAIGDARVKAFEEVATPALNKILDPEKAEDKITPDERKAFVRARRGISKGAMP